MCLHVASSFKERRRRRRRDRDRDRDRDRQPDPPAPVVSRHDPSDSRTSRKSLPAQDGSDILPPTSRSKHARSSLRPRSDSDGESERLPVKPWSPSPANNSNATSSTSVLQYSQPHEENTTNQEDSPTSPSPQLTIALRAVFEMITEELDKFVYTPAPNGLGDIQCRITRDKRGVEKGLFPTYYMHVERPGDGKKVRKRWQRNKK